MGQRGYAEFTLDDARGAVLYKTTVVLIKDNTLILNNGGWVTRSTIKAMNNYLIIHNIPSRVYTKKGIMYVRTTSADIAFNNNKVTLNLENLA